MYKNSCTLIVPGLLQTPAFMEETGQVIHCQFNELELFLARAKCHKTKTRDFETTIFDCFEVPVPADSKLPVAAISYLGDTGNIAKDWVLRADPVHLMPSRDELILTGPASLSLSLLEAEHLVAILNEFFKEDGWQIEVVAPTRWYLHVPEKPGIVTHDISRVLGRTIGEYLPEGPDRKRWRRAMNEVQMVLHRNDVNVERESKNRLPVNSLWFWGEGGLPSFSHSHWSQLWSSDPLSLGLAHLTRTPRDELPVNAHEWLKRVNTPGEQLLVYNHFQHQQFESYDNWIKAIQDFQDDWLKPLLQGMKDGVIDRLTLIPCNGKKYQSSTGGLKRWWCRRKPLDSYYS